MLAVERSDPAKVLGRVSDAPPAPLNVLVAYATLTHPLRVTVEDHLRAFERAGHRCFYVNLMVRHPPRWLARVEFDLIVFHTTFFAQRWVPRHFAKARRRAVALAALPAARVALPQDEFLRSDDVAAFVRDAGVDVVCSVAPPAAWPVIYPDLDRDRIALRQVLTGYLDDRTVARIDTILARTPERPIDIGYRAAPARAWLGRQGALKTSIAEAVRRAAPRHGLRVDISTDARDQIVGDGWFEFLASAKATIGVEGGASICDRDGSIKEASEAYLAAHPEASFEQVEARCFAGRDGELPLAVLSPRHLEACATRTCQILVEGDYNGILRPGEHYLSLRRDLSNLDDVLRVAADPGTRHAIVEAAYRDVVASRVWSYDRLVGDVIEATVGPGPRAHAAEPPSVWLRRRARAFDRRSRAHVVLKGGALRAATRALAPVARRSPRLRAAARGVPAPPGG
jgi:hypothetical protein